MSSTALLGPRANTAPGSTRSRSLGVLAILAVGLVLTPMVYLAVRVAEVTSEELAVIVLQSRAGEFAANTVVLGVAVAATALFGGVAIAVGIDRSHSRFRRAYLVMASLPLAIPSYLAAYGWLVLSPQLNGFLPSYLLLSAVTVPYVVLPVAARLRGVGGAHEMVARTLGRSPVAAFAETVWPQIRSSAFAGALLVFLYTISDFGLVAMMRFHTLTWGVNAAYSASFNRSQAAVLALLVVLLAIIAVVGERSLRGHHAPPSAQAPRAPSLSPIATTLTRMLFWAPLVGGVAVPFIGLTYRLVQADTIRSIDWPRLLEAMGWTVAVAVLAALSATLIALPIAALASRLRNRLTRAVESLGYLSHALPGIVVGLSLVFLSLRMVPALYQTLAILVFGYTVLFASKALGTTRAALDGVPSTLTMVARSLGETPWGAWRRVTLPLAFPSIAVGALLVMVSTMKELPATLILRPTGVNTLATELWSRTVALEYGAAAPYAALLVVVAAIPAMFLGAVRSERGEAR